MDVFKAIKNRRSIRAYRSNPVPQEFLIKILDTARWAPSAGNLQTWEFIVVKEQVIRGYLGDAAFGQDFIGEAPLTIVVCSIEQRSARIYGSRGRLFYCLLDAAAAVQRVGVDQCPGGARLQAARAGATALVCPPVRL